MYYSAHWEIRQMMFWTSSLCLYTNSSTFSTASEKKKKKFRSSRFKSLVGKKTTTTKLQNGLSSRTLCGRVRALRTQVRSSHVDTSSVHTREERKKEMSRPCTVWRLSGAAAENCFLLQRCSVSDHCCTNDIRCLAVVYTA